MLLESYMTLLYWFRKNVRSLERPGTVYCRISVDKTEYNVATSVRVFKDEWDATRQQVRGRSDTAKVANQTLTQLADGLREAFNLLEKEGVLITPERVLQRQQKPQGDRDPLLVVFARYLVARAAQVASGQISQATLDADRVRGNRLEEWLQDTGRPDLRPKELTAARAEQFIEWLRARKRSKNYCLKVVQTFATFLRWCQRHELIEANPMEGFTASFDPPAPLVYLTPAELVKLWFYPFESETLRRVADLFLFQCFTGLAYVDLEQFRGSEHLQPAGNGSVLLRLERQKTGVAAMIPLLRPAFELLARYGGEKLPVPSNQYFNRNLKQIAYVLGLEKRLTTHVGRKTAGMILLQDGVPLTIVSRVLGHTSVRMTEKHYVDVLGDTITQEMARVYGGAVVGIASARVPFLREFTERLLAAA